MPFSYKTILITGASSGIGLALLQKILQTNPTTTLIAVSRHATTTPALETLRSQNPQTVHLEDYDCTTLPTLQTWASSILTRFPTLDCIILNAGIQRLLDFTSPQTIDLETHNEELTLNYTFPLHASITFLPHFLSRPENPGAIILVTSGLAIVPMPTVANYCATKAAVHSLAWSMRSQLAAKDESKHVRVVEIIPPAVHTKLHDGQPQHVHDSLAKVAMSIEAFVDDVWPPLEAGELDEIPVGGVKARVISVETEKRNMFELMQKMMKMAGPK